MLKISLIIQSIALISLSCKVIKFSDENALLKRDQCTYNLATDYSEIHTRVDGIHKIIITPGDEDQRVVVYKMTKLKDMENER